MDMGWLPRAHDLLDCFASGFGDDPVDGHGKTCQQEREDIEHIAAPPLLKLEEHDGHAKVGGPVD